MNPTVEQVLGLLEVARDLSAIVDLDTLVGRVAASAIDTLRCERVTLFLYDRGSDELWSRFSSHGEEIRFPAGSGIAGHTLRSRKTENVPDAYADERFNREIDKRTGFRTRCILSVPLQGHNAEPVGVIQFLNKFEGPYTESDIVLAETFCSLTGVAVQRQLLLDEFAGKQKMMRDLEVAREIQQSLLPKEDPKLAGFDIAGWNRPADETGGDAYDFIELPDGRLVIALADATGHGIGPALVAATCRALIRALCLTTTDLVEIISKANAILNSDLSHGRFLTLFLGIVDGESGAMEYISAGQAPLLYFKAGSCQAQILGADTFPMGILPEMNGLTAQRLVFGPGDVFLLASDGYYEWVNPQEEAFGTDRVIDLVRSSRADRSLGLIDALNDAATSFAAGVKQEDDLTAVVIRRLDVGRR